MNKKIKYGIICVVGIGILLSMCFVCKKYEEKRQIESMKKEEQQAVEAANIAEQYVKKYANSLQNSMAIAPLTDLKVEYQEVTWGEYQYGELSDDEETDPYDTADYHYYYKLSYACDSIDQIFAQMTQNGDYSGYIDLMNKVRMARIEVEEEYKTWEPYEEEINGKIIQVDVEGEYSSNDVMLKKADGQQYFIAQNEHGCWIYVNDELMHEERNFVPDKTPKKPSSGSTSSHYPSDPYDVEDYNDPDDFAEEWAEEFGDGNYDDGYDDAYDYWESERN